MPYHDTVQPQVLDSVTTMVYLTFFSSILRCISSRTLTAFLSPLIMVDISFTLLDTTVAFTDNVHHFLHRP